MEGRKSSLHVVLVEPEIHWNTGNAGRTCLAAGATLHLVGPLGFSLEEREIRRAGLDYWDRVHPVVWKSWEDFEPRLPDLGEAFFFSAQGTRPYWDVAYPEPCVLVFGRESTGLPQAIREKHAHNFLSMPQPGDRSVRSLNLSTAVALAVYEVLRQRHRAEPLKRGP